MGFDLPFSNEMGIMEPISREMVVITPVSVEMGELEPISIEKDFIRPSRAKWFFIISACTRIFLGNSRGRGLSGGQRETPALLLARGNANDRLRFR